MPWLPGLLRLLPPFVMVLSLTGCFKSSVPLLAPAQAEYPFTTMTLKAMGGQISQVKRDGDVYRFIENGKQNNTALLINELAPDLYLIQSASPAGEADFLFAKKQGGELIVISDCKDLDPEMLREQGAEIREIGVTVYDCHFDTFQTLVDLGKSQDIWANPTTTLKIVSIE